MLQKLTRFLGYVVVLAVSLFSLTAVWIIYDGIHDTNGRVDAAVVPGYGEIKDGTMVPSMQERLDAAAKLYHDGDVHSIIVSGVTPDGARGEAEAMASYLKDKNVPSSAVIEVHRGDKADGAMHGVAEVASTQHFFSVVVIDTYYRIVHEKLVLTHEGVKYVGHIHTGDVKKEDVPDIIAEDVAIYKDLNEWYLLPFEKKAGEEGQALGEKLHKDLDATKKIDLTK